MHHDSEWEHWEDSEQDLFEHLRIVADKGQELLRIDKFLMNRVENTSRTKIQAAAEAGAVRVNNLVVKPNYRVKPGDVITLVLAHPPREKEIKPEYIPLDIVYEDQQVVVINKPAGLVVHPGHGNYSGTLVNGLMYHFQQLPFFKEGHTRPGLVHRLDKDTSGVMVLAKDERSMAQLAKQFFERTTYRRYHAIVWGVPKLAEGTVVGNLGRDPRNRMLMKVFESENEGKHAVTHYKILQKWPYFSLLECRLETGRTHQIRAHMKHIGHPLFGDELYGGKQILRGEPSGTYRKFILNCLKICNRQALHALQIGFNHPLTGKNMRFEMPIPDDMKSLIYRFNAYFSVVPDDDLGKD